MSRSISQERFAADAAVNRAYVRGLERQTENPAVDLLDRIAATLAMPSGELFMQPADGELPPAPLRAGRKKA